MNQPLTNSTATLDFAVTDTSTLTVSMTGHWLLRNDLPPVETVFEWIDVKTAIEVIQFDSKSIKSWDSGLLVFLSRLLETAKAREIRVDVTNLPDGVRSLLNLATSVPEVDHSHPHLIHEGMFEHVGRFTLRYTAGFLRGLEFTGDIIMSFIRLVRGKAQFRMADLFLIIEQAGPNALPVVSLVSFLVGLILAYMGAAQLERVGAEIYIADLVAIGMVREIAALMTGIIMAGRTGAAYAAEIGTMKVNEEIDAFKILGISVIDFLVLPRILALVTMIPLLTLYSALVGIIAGLVVSILVFDISFFEYYQQTLRALEIKQFCVGLFKGTTYGVVVALSGCLRGLECGRSALAVGRATTSAVVTSIVYIVVVASALTIVFYKVGI